MLNNERPAVNIATLKIPCNYSVALVVSILKELFSTKETLKIAFIGKNYQVTRLGLLQKPFEYFAEFNDSFFIACSEYLKETKIAEHLH